MAQEYNISIANMVIGFMHRGDASGVPTGTTSAWVTGMNHNRSTMYLAAVVAAMLSACVIDEPLDAEQPVGDESSELASLVADQDQHASSDTENEVEAVRPPPRSNCQANLNGCLDSPLQDVPGDSYGRSVCYDCWEICTGNPDEGWPDYQRIRKDCRWWRYVN